MKTETIKRILNLTQLQQIEIEKLWNIDTDFRTLRLIYEQNKLNIAKLDSLIEKWS
jgi:hypothetical protein